MERRGAARGLAEVLLARRDLLPGGQTVGSKNGLVDVGWIQNAVLKLVGSKVSISVIRKKRCLMVKLAF